jgi:NAD(P)-dependent dehydrogenase (short-subunit alcohol dehydrogenase family)
VAIQTEMLDRFAPTVEHKVGSAAMRPVGRVGRVEEVVSAVLYLASGAGSFVTGVSLPVDGSYLAP